MIESELDGGEAIVEAFRQLGIEYVISSSGSEWPPIWEALSRQRIQGKKGPNYIDCWHESLAVSMAMGYTKASGRMQAVVLHTVVGLLQGSMAIRAAFSEQIPMVICVGESASFGEDSTRDKGSWWLTDLGVVDGPTRFAEPFVKWSSSVKDYRTLYNMVERAGEIASQSPRGPVLISVPFELLLKPFFQPRRRAPVSVDYKQFVDPQQVNLIAQWLSQSSSPVVITESLGESADGFKNLHKLCELLAVPVIEKPARYSNFPTEHPLHLGSDLKSRMNDFDFFLVISDRAPWYPQSSVPSENARVAVVDSCPFRPNMPYQPLYADTYVRADPVLFLEKLVERIQSGEYNIDQNKRNERLARWQSEYKKKTETRQLAIEQAKNKRPIDPVWLCHVLSEVMPKDAVYVEETVTHGDLTRNFILRDNPQSFFHPGGGGLGLGLGTALGVKMALPERFVACLEGDGALLYNPIIQALGAAKGYDLPILIVVFNNHSYGSMKMSHTMEYPKGAAVTSGKFLGVDISVPNFSDFVTSFGGYAAKVDDPAKLHDELGNAISALNSGRLGLVDVVLSK